MNEKQKKNSNFNSMSNTILTLFGEEFAPIPNQGGMKARVKKTTTKLQVTTTEKAEENNTPPALEVEITAPIEESIIQEVKVAPATEKKVVEKKTIVLDAISPDEQKQYQTIGEVAKLFDLNTSHIRFWTKEFNIKVRTTRKGDRLYTRQQIEELKTIYHLVKEKGFTIPGAKTKLKELASQAQAPLDVKAALLKIKNKLQQLKSLV
jgi:DNA-binding transcriptional MerR regulator